MLDSTFLKELKLWIWRLKPNLPELLDVLDIIKKEIAIEKIFLADKIVDYAPELLKEYEKTFYKRKD